MKYIGIVAFSALLASLTMVLAGCKKDDPAPSLTGQQQAAQTLSVTWGATQIVSAPVGGADGTLEDLVFTFTATEDLQPASFSATGAPEFFLTDATSGWSWEGTSTTASILLLNVSPVQEFTIEELTATSLTISFAFDSPFGGRTEGIGEYRVTMTRQ